MILYVDCSNLVYRAFHSMPDSVPMHGTHGFLNMMTRVVADRGPTGVAVAVDEDWRPAFRVERLPMYKTHRLSDEVDPVGAHEQLSRQILEAIGLCVAGAPGYEAEDVIATLLARSDEPAEILSNDRDLYALVRDPDVRVVSPVRGVSEMAVIDEAAITAKYGIPGRAYGDYALLRGDPSDGLPGVPGIGEKTAAGLIARFGSIDALLAAPDAPVTAMKKIAAARDYLDAARAVVLPVADAPVPDIPVALPTEVRDPEGLLTLIAPHNLDAVVARLLDALEIKVS